ncbi:chemotaxis response regulator protein-glutamate methylesterase [Bacillus sp. D386]|uniref:protein-glutamate methylesterase/protein-glutamine glutaminase n=1 Tax=Bacillus sp. D386 TaxID=2587155 RepID=UPI0011243060|nr:chemotaxis response regulator protein-glutamate methylesterase [Bacillus sp. D386]
MAAIKVLIIEDSPFMRKLITEFLQEDEQIEVVGIARNGADGLLKMEKLKPDVITLDIEMPVMDGITTLQVIMEKNPMPVVILSGTNRSGVDMIMESMKLGAVNFIEKPSGSFSQDLHRIKSLMIQKVKEAAKVNMSVFDQNNRLMNVPPIAEISQELNLTENVKEKNTDVPLQKIICIGTSTGGPRALYTVLPLLKKITVPILIVQHMPEGFTKHLAERLNELSEITVKEAEEGEILCNGTAYIAPGGFHLKASVQAGVLIAKLDKTNSVNGHRPSVDVLFDSVSELPPVYECVAVIMTGMGSDGTKGIMNLRKFKKSRIIAESEETCVVYGMPKAAIATGLVDEIIPLGHIAGVLNEICKGER